MLATHLRTLLGAALLAGFGAAAAVNAQENQPPTPPAAPMEQDMMGGQMMGGGDMMGMMNMMQQMSQMMETCNQMMQEGMRDRDGQPEGVEPTP